MLHNRYAARTQGMISGKGAKFYIGREEGFFVPLRPSLLGTAVEKRGEVEDRAGRRSKREGQGEGGGGRGEETEKREGRKNSVPVQKPTKRGEGEGGGRRGVRGEGLEYPERCIQVKRGRRDRLLSRKEGEKEGEGGRRENGARWEK